MDERYAAKLARHRVGADLHMGVEMSQEDIYIRRQYMRNMLTVNPSWRDCTDDQIDKMRIYRVGDDWYIEDEDFYEYPL
ncbi:MAG: hypothetical protein ACI4F1_03750 [Bariatricus sp.]